MDKTGESDKTDMRSVVFSEYNDATNAGGNKENLVIFQNKTWFYAP